MVAEVSADGIVIIGLPAGCNDFTISQDADFDIIGLAEGGLHVDINTLATVDAEFSEDNGA